MSSLALYRKYRSQTFGDLVGQEHVIRTLQNALKTGRISHAYLFTGPRGTGKTSTARLLAKALNCENGPGPEPCNQCETCKDITTGNCFDVVEMDAASKSGVDYIRDKVVAITDYRPSTCRYKIFIIDEVHDLSKEAFDALLKTIEEPPEHVIFILATTEYTKVPPTIRSRCQKFDFHRASTQDLVRRLEYVVKSEGAEADSEALNVIARLADGGYRDALTLLEQALLVSEGPLSVQAVHDQLGLIDIDLVDSLLSAIREAKPGVILDTLERVYASGRDSRAILESMVYRISDLTKALYQVGQDGEDAATAASRHAVAIQLGPDLLARVRHMAAQAQRTIREVTLPRLWLEAELLDLTQPKPAPKASIDIPTAAPKVVKEAPAPVRETAPSPPPKPTPAVAVVPDGDDLSAAQALWMQVVQGIGAQSRTAGAKLGDSRVVSLEGDLVKVCFDKQLSFDWVQTKAKFLPLLHDSWSLAISPRTWKLELVLATQDSSQSDPVPVVERPLEGDSLRQVGRETFGEL